MEQNFKNNRTAETTLALACKYLTVSSCRQVLQAFQRGHGLLQAALESCNVLLNQQVPQIMREKPEVIVENDRKLKKILWKLEDVTICKPTITENNGIPRHIMPDEARIRKQTYGCTVFVSFSYKEFQRETTSKEYQCTRTVKHHNKPYCLFPVMVRSHFCNTVDMPEEDKESSQDHGGYFIVNGTEKAIIMQEKMRTNIPYVRSLGSGQKYSHMCEIRSLAENKIRSTSTLYIYITPQRGYSPPKVFVVIPFVAFHIPLYAVFRMIGVHTKEQMVGYVLGHGSQQVGVDKGQDKTLRHLVSCIMDDDLHGTANMTTEEIFQYVGKKGTAQPTNEGRSRRVQHTVTNEFLPHMGLSATSDVLQRKASYFGLAIRKLMMIYVGRWPVDDRDDYMNKRIETPGRLLALLFRQVHRNYLKMVQVTLRKIIDSQKRFNPMNLLTYKKISSNMQYPLATGNWGLTKGGSTQTGVAQVLSRMTSVATLSHLRRINTPISREGKRAEPRQLNHSHFAVVCPAETPEGESCLALDTQVALPGGLFASLGSLRDGDVVLTVDTETLELRPTSIYRCFVVHNRITYDLVLEDGRSIVATADHPFLLGQPTLCGTKVALKWTQVQHLAVGDRLCVKTHSQLRDTSSLACRWSAITSIERRQQATPVADFTTRSKHHSFVANGFVSHNCGLMQVCWLISDDRWTFAPCTNSFSAESHDHDARSRRIGHMLGELSHTACQIDQGVASLHDRRPSSAHYDIYQRQTARHHLGCQWPAERPSNATSMR